MRIWQRLVYIGWSKMTLLCIALRNWEIFFLSYRDFRCTTKHTILLIIYFSMSYMLCNLPLLNSGGSSGAATLNVVGFFFLDRCTQWNILWKPRSINMSHPLWKWNFKKKSANLLWQYLLKRKTYKNTVSKYRFACCKPNPNYRKNV